MAQKYYHSGLSGAPVLNGVAGSLVALLDAVLKDGWGLATATSVVIAGGVATATFASAHAADADITVRVAGATPSSLNGDKIVTAKSGNTISWPTTEPNGTATGTITVKIAPLDFAKPFVGTNKGVYKSTDPAATGFCLRVDDTGTTAARVVGYEAMSDVDTGTNAFPTAVQQSGGGYWMKSSAANSTAIPWEIVGDERGFYFLAGYKVATNAAYTGRSCLWFGDINSFKSGDAYGCVLVAGTNSADVASANVGYSIPVTSVATYPSYVARSYTQVGTSTRGVKASMSVVSDASSGANAFSGSVLSISMGNYPAGPDSSLRIAPIFFLENTNAQVTSTQVRGVFPGAYASLLYILPGTFSPRDTIDATGEMAGKKLLASGPYAGDAAAITIPGAFFLDIKGAWR